MNPSRIDDPADPRVAAYLNIKERDLVGRRDHFIAEGEVVLRSLLTAIPNGQAGRHEIVSLLLAEKRLPALEVLLQSLPPETPILVAGQHVLDRIAGFHLHRGILAFGRRLPLPGIRELLRQTMRVGGVPPTFVLLVGVANHDNIGGIFRNAAAFGAAGVILDPTCCDPYYRKAIRVSAGAVLRVPIAKYAKDDDAIAILQECGYDVVAFGPAGAVPLHEFGRTGPLALVFGTEGPGLPGDILSRLTTIRIAMAPGTDSLNVATASGIALHQVTTSTDA